jgi:hypothetical protein
MHTHTGLNLGEPTGTSSSPRSSAPGNASTGNTRMQPRHPPQPPLTPPATQQGQPIVQPPVQQNRPINQPPAQHINPNGLPPTGSIPPAEGARQPVIVPQSSRPAAGDVNPIGPQTMPPAISPTPLSQADEIQALKTRLERYEKDGTPLANTQQPQVLFSDQDTIDRVKAATAPSKDDGKKLVLPDVVPGFKASSLDVGKFPILSRSIFSHVATAWWHIPLPHRASALCMSDRLHSLSIQAVPHA